MIHFDCMANQQADGSVVYEIRLIAGAVLSDTLHFSNEADMLACADCLSKTVSSITRRD
jgi:hypothetical protein